MNAMGGTRAAADSPTGHSTQKPVRLFEIPIKNHTHAGQSVYDPFVGSGTTLIAAERTGRVAYVMDLDARYVQVVVDRWEQLTGNKATKLSATAKPHSRRSRR